MHEVMSELYTTLSRVARSVDKRVLKAEEAMDHTRSLSHLAPSLITANSRIRDLNLNPARLIPGTGEISQPVKEVIEQARMLKTPDARSQLLQNHLIKNLNSISPPEAIELARATEQGDTILTRFTQANIRRI